MEMGLGMVLGIDMGLMMDMGAEDGYVPGGEHRVGMGFKEKKPNSKVVSSIKYIILTSRYQ